MVVTSLLDTILDRSVLAGYTQIGYQLRRLHWDDAQPRLDGRTVLVTGASGGLGKAASVLLARRGAALVLLVRSLERAESARKEILAAAQGTSVELVQCDVADLDSVRKAASSLPAQIDVLVHNAGVLPATRTESPQGHELSLATHVLGPLLLTELLRPALTDGRVIFVSSGGMYTQKLPVSDPQYRSGRYRGATAYARTKRIQVSFVPLLDRRWADRRTAVHAMHPGWANTPGVVDSLPGFHRVLGPALRTPEQGADTVAWLAGAQPPPEERPILARSSAAPHALSTANPIFRRRSSPTVGLLRRPGRHRSGHRATAGMIRGMQMSVPREELSWELFGVAGRELASTIAGDGFAPDLILSIARGGLFVAGALGYALDVKNLHVMNVEYYTGVNRRLDLPVVLPPVPNAVDLAGATVLVADDVADTGATLKLVRDFCAEHVAEVRCAVIYQKPTSEVACEYVWRHTEKWINFPWSVLPPVIQHTDQVLDA